MATKVKVKVKAKDRFLETFRKHREKFVTRIYVAKDLWHVLETWEKDKNTCFTAATIKNKQRLVVCYKDSAGYHDTQLVFKTESYEEALEICRDMNEMFFSLSNEKAQSIVSSTM
jgi:hypothetical protein